MNKQVKAVFMVFLVVFIPFLSGCNQEDLNKLKDQAVTEGQAFFSNLHIKEQLNESSINLAVNLAPSISGFNKINYDTFENYDKFKSFIENANYMIKIINKNTGTTFDIIDIDQTEFKEVARVVQKYSPLITPYNNLIDKSQLVSRDDPESITDFYIASFAFSADIFLIQSGAIHNQVFRSLGYLNKYLHLYVIRSVCGNACFGFVLKSIYWFIRENVEEFSIGFFEWLEDEFAYIIDYIS